MGFLHHYHLDILVPDRHCHKMVWNFDYASTDSRKPGIVHMRPQSLQSALVLNVPNRYPAVSQTSVSHQLFLPLIKSCLFVRNPRLHLP